MIRSFETIVFQLFLDMLRASGMALNNKQLDALRAASQGFSASFKSEAQLACLQFLKEFQDNVKETIVPLEERVAALEAKKSKQLSNVVDKAEKNPDN